MNHSVKNLFTAKTRTIRKREHAVARLRIYSLEPRTAPAAALTASFDYADGVLRIEGTDGPDVIRIFNAADQVSVAGIPIRSTNSGPVWTNVPSIFAADIRYVDVRALAGNDRVEVNESNFTPETSPPLVAHGQQGNDTLIGSSAADGLYGGTGDDVLSGRGGGDVIEAGFSSDVVNAQAAQLDRDLGLYASEKYEFENWGGRSEKWLWGSTPDMGYFILPNGELYRMDNTYQPEGVDVPALVDEAKAWFSATGDYAASGTLIATLDPSYHQNLLKLVNAGVLAGAPLAQDALGPLAAQLDRDLGLGVEGEENIFGQGEKWLADVRHSFAESEEHPEYFYYLLADGRLYRSDSWEQLGGELVATLDPSYYANPSKLDGAQYLFGDPMDNDTAAGDAGNDTIVGGDGADSLAGGLDNDRLVGGNDNDTLRGDTGNDELVGCHVGFAGEVGNPNDSIWGGTGDDSLYGGDGADTLQGQYGNDYFRGDGGNDVLYGGANNDLMDGGDGSDFMAGGVGDDTYTFAAAPAAETDSVVEISGAGIDTLDFSRLAADNPVAVTIFSPTDMARHTNRVVAVGAGGTTALEHAVGGAGNDRLVGNARPNRLDGGFGADTLNGMFANDTLYGGDGNDTLDGSSGWDLIDGQAGNDTLTGADGSDVMGGGPGDDRLDGEVGNDWLFGGDGNDTLLGGEGVDYLGGEGGHDRMEGDSGRDTYDGGDGNDYGYEYGDTADSFNGGDGNDRYSEASTSNGNDTAVGGAGDDVLETGLNNDSLVGGEGNDTLAAGENDDTLLGEAGNDWLTGGPTWKSTIQSDNDRLDGGTGDDVQDGGHNLDPGGQPRYRDSLFGGRGNYILNGGKSREYLNGGPGRDVLYGDDERDTLVSADGLDVIAGGGGEPDLVYPGRGADVVTADSFDRVVDITEIDSISPTSGDAPAALQPGTLVTIRGTDLPVNAHVQFGGGYFIPVAAAEATDVTVSPDRTTITARVPRGAMSGTVWVYEIVGTPDNPNDAIPDDDRWASAPGHFEVRTFRNTYGFNFRNFGFNVDMSLVQKAFGAEQTNIVIPPGVVTPVPTPQAWAFLAFSDLAFNGKGACFGMALMSQHLAHHPEWINAGIGLPPYAAPTVFNLTKTGELVEFIERFHQHQLSQQMIDYTIGWKLSGHSKEGVKNQIRNLLLAGDRPLISFQNAIGKGHVVVAYDIEDALETGELDDYYIHTYDPNRQYGSSLLSTGETVLDTAEMNGQDIANSRIYIGSNGLSAGNEWRYLMDSGENWAGGFGNFMVIPYGTVPPSPTFPGTLSSLADLILGTQAAGGAADAPAGVAVLVSAEGLSPRPADPVRVPTPDTVEGRAAEPMQVQVPVPTIDVNDAPPPSLPSWEGLTESDEWKESIA